MRWARVPWVTTSLLLAVAHGHALAQVEPDSIPRDSVTSSTPPPTGGWMAYGVVPHPWSTVVAVTVVLPVGSAQDPESAGGTAWLLGRTSRREILGRLTNATADVSVDVDRGRTVYRVITSPDRWEDAYGVLIEVLFEGASPSDGLDQERTSILALMAFEAGAPVRSFELETYRLIGGVSSPWTREPRGTPESLSTVTPSDLAAYREQYYERARAVLSVTGALDAETVARTVTGEATEGTADETHVAIASPPVPSGAPAWGEGERVHLVRDVTSGWIAAAYPVAPSAARTAVEFLAQRARSELMTQPPAPGLFSMDIGLEALPGGGDAILIRAAVLPDALDPWEARILETMARISSEILDPGFLRFHRRRFRNVRLVEDAAPEIEGLRSALDLMREGRIRDLPTEIWSLDSQGYQQATTALGSPRVLVFGPDLVGDDRP